MKSSITVYSSEVLSAAAETQSHAVEVDFSNEDWGRLNILAAITNDPQRGPASGRSIFIDYAFTDTKLDSPSLAPSVLSNSMRVMALKLNATPGIIKMYNSGGIEILGDYMYFWIHHADILAPVTLDLQVINLTPDLRSGISGVQVYYYEGDPNNHVISGRPAICYGPDGSVWLKTGAGVNDTGWTCIIAGQ